MSSFTSILSFDRPLIDKAKQRPSLSRLPVCLPTLGKLYIDSVLAYPRLRPDRRPDQRRISPKRLGTTMLRRHINTSSERLSEDQVYELSEMFRLMSDPSRLRIILSCLAEKVSVGDMAQQLKLSPSLVSHHLRLLRAARLLQAERQGRQVFYQVTDEHVLRMLGDMVDHVAEEHDLEVT
jgi:ArsR family transcriptional regulator